MSKGLDTNELQSKMALPAKTAVPKRAERSRVAPVLARFEDFADIHSHEETADSHSPQKIALVEAQ